MSSLISPAGDALPDLAALLTQGGELVPALALYHTRHPALGFVIQHPLVYFVPYFSQMAAYANEMLRQKEAALKSAIENKDWGTAVFLHERPWRCEAFSLHADGMDDKTYWSLLAQIYTDSENIDENFETWADLLTSSRPGRAAFMHADEQAFLSRLPEEIQVYRGGADESVADFSSNAPVDTPSLTGLLRSNIKAEPTTRLLHSAATSFKEAGGSREVVFPGVGWGF